MDERLVHWQYDQNTGVEVTERFYHRDHQGSIIAMSDAGGARPAGELYTYDAYGNMVTGTTSGQPFRYTGRRWDDETGLYYYRARYYSAELGRFLQTDPIGYEDNMNMYGYVGNDPVNATDPSGKVALVGAGVGFAVGALFEAGRQYVNGEDFQLGKVLVSGAAGALIGSGAGLIAGAIDAGTVLGTGLAAKATLAVVPNAIVGAGVSAGKQAAFNALDGEPLGQGVEGAAIEGGLINGVTGPAGIVAGGLTQASSLFGNPGATTAAGKIVVETLIDTVAEAAAPIVDVEEGGN